MGTSQSSNGSPGGVPMVLPWVPDAAPTAVSPPEPAQPGSEPSQEQPAAPAAAPTPAPMAPAGRFSSARRSLGAFAGSGSGTAMRRGIGNYVRSGYKGASGTTRRFGGTAETANALFGALSGASGAGPAAGTPPVDLQQMKGQSAQNIIDAVIEAVRPIDGTQDAEASRAAIGEALSELLKQFPNTDLTQLSPEQVASVIESYVALDVYRRIELDLGKHIQAKAPTAKAFLSRLKTVKNYIKQTVSSAFKKLKAAGQQLTAGKVNAIVRAALSETFSVFEGYAR